MNLPSVFAQVLWAAGNLPSAARFARALKQPEQAQSGWLMRRLCADADSVFGREHDFRSVRNRRDFVRKVPLRDWSGFSPWIERIRTGEQSVLGMEPVTRMAPTSGSSGARKLIPFTASLHQSFAIAVGAWMADLTRLEPGILGGPAYWSISPLTADESVAPGEPPVGFADDAEYLGGWKAGLVRHLMAVPRDIVHERDPQVFWRRTAACLLARRDLRLISVWHPSFLELILGAAATHWDGILESIEKRRATMLRRIGPENPAAWWPALRVISCWGDQAAEPGMRELGGRFPKCRVQPKGLLATEAVVTIPWQGRHPLAVSSHFFEFLTDDGGLLAAHELERGRAYEVVVTNGGGLWRYRLGDRVECDGFCGATPTLRFLGRAGNVSDLCGEKLSEPFVAECFMALWPDGVGRPATAFLRPCRFAGGKHGYLLVVDRPVDEALAERLFR
ncbi:MAG: GH3 auxin-responsive promoter family protein, partial [Akkermansiaceae bacterium]|nr:GH3 auxin-responsive promoter family protein [Akkermansiaceae bacterium]